MPLINSFTFPPTPAASWRLAFVTKDLSDHFACTNIYMYVCTFVETGILVVITIRSCCSWYLINNMADWLCVLNVYTRMHVSMYVCMYVCVF